MTSEHFMLYVPYEAISSLELWHTQQNDTCLVYCVIYFHCQKWCLLGGWWLQLLTFVFTLDHSVRSVALKWPLFSLFCAKCQDPTGFGNASCLCEQWAWQRCLVSIPSRMLQIKCTIKLVAYFKQKRNTMQPNCCQLTILNILKKETRQMLLRNCKQSRLNRAQI